ncbi:MAG: nucleoside-diphosphate kinase [Selenomonadaceae bacterium]|nr:nucleoside-diphosphate kinase [Selenomonadaceae bacterium]
MEETLVLIKPDAVRKKHIGDIIKIYEANDLEITAMRMLTMTKELAAKHYVEHLDRPYYSDLEGFMTSAPIVAMILKGEDAIKRVREINGKTNPKDAAEGTIRKLYAENGSRNAVHASDSPENAKREINIFFGE